jgi:ATP-dependent RNA helicase RhlE
MSFEILGLAEPIARALADAKYTTPTPIQLQAIPPALLGRDLVGIAQTGTGKTAAFALPILNRLAANPRRMEPKTTRVLVLSPTRELSGQIVDSFSAYGRHLRLRIRLAIGGVPIGKQIRALAEGTDVLVATPGRLMDLQRSRAIRLDQVEVLVLDEADRMLDMGFIRDIEAIVASVPKTRQTLFFSATMPAEIERLAGKMLSDPVKVAVTPVASTAERVEQRVAYVDRGAKPGLLADYLKSEPIDRALVFTRTKHGADKVVRVLDKAGIESSAIHGNKSQPQREKTLAAFRNGRIRVLIATDIAARGIDVTGISHVFNFDLPEVPETYVHRIGRTARAGRDGIAISLCSSDEIPLLNDIEKLTRIELTNIHGERPAKATKAAAEPRGQQRPRGGQQRNGQRQGRPEQRSEGREQRPQRERQRPQGQQQAKPGNGGGHRRHAERPRYDPLQRDREGISAVAFMRPTQRAGQE